MRRPLALGFIAAVSALAIAGAGVKLWAQSAGSGVLPEVKAVLTTAPQVPPPVDRQGAARVKVNLEMTEVTATLADGVKYAFWTFGGTVPAPSSACAWATSSRSISRTTTAAATRTRSTCTRSPVPAAAAR